MAYLEELLPEFRKGAKIRYKGRGNDTYIEMNKSTGVIINNEGRRYIFSYEDFTHSCWELYQEPDPDWEYIIKNKCLCWFWCEHEEEKKVAGLLADYDSYNSQFGRYKGKNVAVTYFDHCRPVRRDEITFYEERNND